MKPFPLISAFLAAMLAATPAPAQSVPSPVSASTVISLGGKQIMNIRTGAGGFTPQQRADAVSDRLVPILSITNLTPADVHVQQKRAGQDASITVRGHLLITVDRTLAQVNGMTPYALAEKWAGTLAAVLPQVNAHPNPNGM